MDRAIMRDQDREYDECLRIDRENVSLSEKSLIAIIIIYVDGRSGRHILSSNLRKREPVRILSRKLMESKIRCVLQRYNNVHPP